MQMPETEQEINKAALAAVEEGKIPSYKLEVILHPDGMKINQTPNRVSPFDVIGILEIVKSIHTKYFNDMMNGVTGPIITKNEEKMEEKAAEQ